ncbi:Apc13p-domain-containing protein [Zopfia rhizophila CBS 207.26]|uniref:Apc13p-domain-containing protein n=1 Tax=Zopfia rhizophila CBS 207.26 TaxID=1314779 RepID=A0A6A6EDC9_9PEZI|nr:Apc13p-domain-containing protein [Zopfia rhizophila CBS 207.26]
MSRDSSATHLHLHSPHHADLLEAFTQKSHSHPSTTATTSYPSTSLLPSHSTSQIPPEDIYVPPHLQPLNPEDEDDVVPDQHAAFGIQRATQKNREVVWRDLGLEELVRRGPGGRSGAGGNSASGGSGVGGQRGGVGTRVEEPVVLALRRRPGASGSGAGVTNAAEAGGGAGNGLPR